MYKLKRWRDLWLYLISGLMKWTFTVCCIHNMIWYYSCIAIVYHRVHWVTLLRSLNTPETYICFLCNNIICMYYTVPYRPELQIYVYFKPLILSLKDMSMLLWGPSNLYHSSFVLLTLFLRKKKQWDGWY